MSKPHSDMMDAAAAAVGQGPREGDSSSDSDSDSELANQDWTYGYYTFDPTKYNPPHSISIPFKERWFYSESVVMKAVRRLLDEPELYQTLCLDAHLAVMRVTREEEVALAIISFFRGLFANECKYIEAPARTPIMYSGIPSPVKDKILRELDQCAKSMIARLERNRIRQSMLPRVNAQIVASIKETARLVAALPLIESADLEINEQRHRILIGMLEEIIKENRMI